MLLVVAQLAPKEVKEPFPRQWGKLEALTGIDHTGFAFTSINGQGNCRIVNTRLALRTPGSKIVFGIVKPLSGKSFPHLWAVDKDNKILDESCNVTNLNCLDRKVFAVIDPITLTLEKANPQSQEESYQVNWGMLYLSGFKEVFSH